jgi:hypothetical protein
MWSLAEGSTLFANSRKLSKKSIVSLLVILLYILSRSHLNATDGIVTRKQLLMWAEGEIPFTPTLEGRGIFSWQKISVMESSYTSHCQKHKIEAYVFCTNIFVTET